MRSPLYRSPVMRDGLVLCNATGLCSGAARGRCAAAGRLRAWLALPRSQVLYQLDPCMSDCAVPPYGGDAPLLGGSGGGSAGLGEPSGGDGGAKFSFFNLKRYRKYFNVDTQVAPGPQARLLALPAVGIGLCLLYLPISYDPNSIRCPHSAR